MSEKAFGMPAFVQPHNINVPKKGTRQTMHFREDAQRLPTVPPEIVNYNWSRAKGEDATVPNLSGQEDALLGMLYEKDVLLDDNVTAKFRAVAISLVGRGFATQSYLTLSVTVAGIQWYKAKHNIKGIYEQEDGGDIPDPSGQPAGA